MSDQIKKYCFSSIMQDGVACTSPTLTVIGSTGLEVSCVIGTCVEFSLTEGAESHCITVQIDCHSCDCDPLIETKCFCDESSDCPTDCEYCNADGICVSNCPTGQYCDESTCVDCLLDGDCPCNQKCIQGHCQCENPGDVINNQGCCVDCVNNQDCGPCEVCLNGDCVPKDCGTGHCNPITGECDECYTDAHCGANECCVGGNCVCCEGFHQDPLTGLCVPTPECFTSDDCKDCEDCINYGCVPRICPDPDQICINDTCIDGCVDPDDCPAGYGCLNGECVPCSSLTCDGGVSLCQQAKGCECSGTTCVPVDCTVLDNCVTWDVVRATSTPGTVIPGTGLPAVSFTSTWVDLGLVTMPGGGSFRNYRFTITETSGATGNFSVYGYSLGTGNSVSFELDDATPIQWNNVGFEIDFTESNPGSRTASIVFINQNWYNGGSGFQQDLFIAPALWSYNVQANAIPPSTTGGTSTPGSLKLCACNPNAEIVGWDWNTIEGNLTVTFNQLPDGCLRATVQGCGTGEGTITIDCAGFISTIPIPPLPFDYSGSACCDPITDPTCSGNPDESTPCNVVDILQGTIVLSQFGSVTPSGAGVFRGVFQPSSVGISPFDWIRAARAGVCWSTTGTMVPLATFSFPGLPFSFQDVEYTLGAGCLKMGHTCSIRIGLCKEVQAEVCLSGCDAFVVSIVNNAGTLTAITSLGNSAQLLFNWYENLTPSMSGPYPDYTADGNNQIYVLPNPNTTVRFITVNVQISVNGQLCFAQDIERFEVDVIAGCRNVDACNYSSSATADAACCYLRDVSYSCSSGLLIPTACPGVDYFVVGTPNIAYTHPGLYLEGGTSHTIIGSISGLEVCRTEITPPSCYRCVTGECLPAPSNSNFGEFTDDPDCGFSCGCDLTIDVNHDCVGNQSAIKVTTYGGSGSYTVTVKDDLDVTLYGPVAATTGVTITTSTFCNRDYKVYVNDVNGVPGACGFAGYHTNCFSCVNSTTAIYPHTNPFDLTVQYSCTIDRFIFTIIPDSCASYYDVTVVKNTDLNTVLATAHWGNLTSNLVTSIGLADACNGDYTLTITDSNGCTNSQLATVTCNNCGDPIPECPLTSFGVGLYPGVLDYKFVYNLEIDPAAPTYTYVFEVFNTDNPTGPGCGGNAVGSPIYSFSSPLPGGSYTGFLPMPGSFTYPAVQTCYIVRVRGNSPLPSSCRTEQLISVPPVSPPPTGCSLISSNISTYNTVSQNFSLSWNFASSSGDITLEATVWDSGTCGVGSSTISTFTGLPAINNNHPFALNQIDGVAQCVEFEVYDTNNPTCTTGVISRAVPACTCSVSLTDVIYNSGLERLEIEWLAGCATVPTGFTIEVFERSLAGCGGTTTLLTSYAVTSLSGLQYHSITAPGADRYIEVVITDDVNAACTDSACVVVVGCNDCATQFVDIPGSRINSLEDNNGTIYVLPSGSVFNCVNTGDPSAANDAAALAVQNHLIALGDCGAPIVTWASLVANTATCMNSGISYGGPSASTYVMLSLDINGNLYSTNITWATRASGGVVTLSPTGESDVEQFVLDSLNTEGIPFDNVQVSTYTSGGATGAAIIKIVIQGIDITEVITAEYDSTASGGGTNTDLFDTIGCVDLGEGAEDGTCIRMTIAGSGIIFASADVGNNTYTFDNSGC
jgi:hypothetical protein